jgi:hypothetical protein
LLLVADVDEAWGYYFNHDFSLVDHDVAEAATTSAMGGGSLAGRTIWKLI